jgi:protein gp37
MADKTGIEWTDATWNPVVGCSVISPGCTNCYAMRQAARIEKMGAAKYAGLTRPSTAGPVWTGTVRLDEAALDQPIRWRRPRRIFVNSMSDLFHEALPDEAIDRVFAVMALAPQHTFQVLTKRAARMREWTAPKRGAAGRIIEAVETHFPLNDRNPALRDGWRWPLPNVWLGVSVERQQEADERIPELLATPAALRFVSAEPLLGPVDLAHIATSNGVGHRDALRGVFKSMPANVRAGRDIVGRATIDVPVGHRIDWVIAGGESGPNARPCHPDWARSLRDQCQAAGVPFFWKQWGEWTPGENVPDNGRHPVKVWFDDRWGDASDDWAEEADHGPLLYRVGKRRAGALLDGREHREFPL